MPCYDGRDREDQINNERRLNTLTALLCAHLTNPDSVKQEVTQWKILHDRVDRSRRRNNYKDEMQMIAHYNAYMDLLHQLFKNREAENAKG